MKTKVVFVYDEPSLKWEVFVEGVKDDIQARQALNAVIVTIGGVTPDFDANRAVQLPDGTFEIVASGLYN
jgi:hypothetical protein